MIMCLCNVMPAWEGLGCVADHIPFVGNIYGLCDEVVQLCGASYNIGHNCREIVAWAQHMQVSSTTVSLSVHVCYVCLVDPSKFIYSTHVHAYFIAYLHCFGWHVQLQPLLLTCCYLLAH
jgi:hypothetical protein